MKKRFFIIAATILAAGIILAGCMPAQISGPAATDTQEPSTTLAASDTPEPSVTPSATLTLSPTPTMTHTPTTTITPTPTMTPTLISFQSAAGRKELSEIEIFGRGSMQLQDFSPDGSMYVVVVARGIYVFDPATWEEISVVPLPPGQTVQSIAFSLDSSLFAAGDLEGNVTFRDTRTWEVTQVFKAHNGPVIGLDISPDNTKCVTIGDDKMLTLWDLSSGTKLNSRVITSGGNSAHYSYDGSKIWVDEGSELTTWDSTNLFFVDRKYRLGRYMAGSPYDNLVAGFYQKDLIVYDFETREETRFEEPIGKKEITKLVFMDKNRLIVETTDEGKIYLANLETKSFLPVSKDDLLSEENMNPDLGLITRSEEIQALGFTRIESILSIMPDGETLILWDGLFDLQGKAVIDVDVLEELDLSLSNGLDDGNLAIIDLPELPNYKKVLKGTLTIITLDPQDFSTISRQPINFDLPDEIEDAALSPDGSILAAGLKNGSVYFWDTKTGEQVADLRAHNKVFGYFGFYGSINDIKFSGDGLHIMTVGMDKTIKIWRVADFSQVSTLYGSKAAFSPDGASLAIVDSYNRIQVQSLLENTPPVVFDGHKEAVTELLFSKDGSLVISGSRDKTIKIWSIADKALQLDLPQYGVVYSLVLSPDGSRLYSWAGDGVISVWGYSAP